MGHSMSDLSLVLSFMLQTSPVTCGSCVVPPDLLSTLKGTFTFSYSPIVSGGPIYIYIYCISSEFTAEQRKPPHSSCIHIISSFPFLFPRENSQSFSRSEPGMR